MAEYIERDKLGIGRCNPEVFEDKGYAKGWNDAIDIIQSAPAADVRPVVRAQIIDMRYVEEDGEWKCSRCGWQYTLCVCGKDVTSKIHFCPNCGADMRPTSMSGANGEES